MRASSPPAGDPGATGRHTDAQTGPPLDAQARADIASSNGQRPAISDNPLVVGMDVLDRVVQRVFSATLPLSSARSMMQGVAAARLDEGIDELDHLVRDIHHTVLATYRHGPDVLPVLEQAPTNTSPIGSASHLVDEAANALDELDAVLSALWEDAMVSSNGDPDPRARIADAARLVHLTRVALASRTIR